MSNEIGTYWSELHPVNTNLDDHFFDQARQLDNEIFKVRGEHGPQYG
jgi:hypothetical protein